MIDKLEDSHLSTLIRASFSLSCLYQPSPLLTLTSSVTVTKNISVRFCQPRQTKFYRTPALSAATIQWRRHQPAPTSPEHRTRSHNSESRLLNSPPAKEPLPQRRHRPSIQFPLAGPALLHQRDLLPLAE